MIMAAESVLDVGCGTGSLLHWARESGHEGRLVGLDPAEGMLAQARRRDDVEWVLGDLSTVSWEDEFDFAVMTGHAFQVLLTDDELRTAFAAIGPFENGYVTFKATYESPDWDAPKFSRSTLRFLDVPSLGAFVSEAGLAVDEQYGYWDRSPVTATSPEIITIVRRP